MTAYLFPARKPFFWITCILTGIIDQLECKNTRTPFMFKHCEVLSLEACSQSLSNFHVYLPAFSRARYY